MLELIHRVLLALLEDQGLLTFIREDPVGDEDFAFVCVVFLSRSLNVFPLQSRLLIWSIWCQKLVYLLLATPDSNASSRFLLQGVLDAVGLQNVFHTLGSTNFKTDLGATLRRFVTARLVIGSTDRFVSWSD